jgi:hypothetical protein
MSILICIVPTSFYRINPTSMAKRLEYEKLKNLVFEHQNILQFSQTLILTTGKGTSTNKPDHKLHRFGRLIFDKFGYSSSVLGFSCIDSNMKS